jgi:hypothetical protein
MGLVVLGRNVQQDVRRNHSCAACAGATHFNFRCSALARMFEEATVEEATAARCSVGCRRNGHADNGDDMMLQNLVKARQARDAVIGEICDGLPSHCTEEQALRLCQDKDLLTRLELIDDRIRIVEAELVSCGRAYRLRLGDVVLRNPMRRWRV